MSASFDEDGFRDPVTALARLRAVVAYLGEADQLGWWRTSFLSPTGRRLLEYNFPRTVLSAAVAAASHAARQLHDKTIATSGAHHLFRLPHDLEVRVHGYLVGEGASRLSGVLVSREAALEALVGASEGETGAGVGPRRISTTGRITHRPSLRKTAACYAAAFGGSDRVFPYFSND